MYRIVSFLFLFATSLHQLGAQIFPKDGRELCYRLIGFQFPPIKGASEYTLEIATGRDTTERIFEQNIAVSVTSRTNKVVAEVPYFGCAYSWRVESKAVNSVKKGTFHHFSTIKTDDVDTDLCRVRVLKETEKYQDFYVFMDGIRALYDMDGKAVWFLPGIQEPSNKDVFPRDLKATPQGTITFITHYKPYEITYDGEIIWTYNPKSKDTFHHEFTRLNNGHYLCMMFDSVNILLPQYKGKTARNAEDSSRYYRRMHVNWLLEYDGSKLVWNWCTASYLQHSDLMTDEHNGVFDINDLHDNSFYFDEYNKVVYLSFRNVNRIIKIKYPEGNVLCTYGPVYKKGMKAMNNDLFCGQHSCGRTANGYLYLFDNNTCGEAHMPRLEILKEPEHCKGPLTKIWEYECTIDDTAMLSSRELRFISGGSMEELPDGSFFASMSQPYCKAFIVDRNKHELWSAVPERYDTTEHRWTQPTELYRASIISRKELERLIWNSER